MFSRLVCYTDHQSHISVIAMNCYIFLCCLCSSRITRKNCPLIVIWQTKSVLPWRMCDTRSPTCNFKNLLRILFNEEDSCLSPTTFLWHERALLSTQSSTCHMWQTFFTKKKFIFLKHYPQFKCSLTKKNAAMLQSSQGLIFNSWNVQINLSWLFKWCDRV